MTPEDRVREFWEKRETPLSVASITELVRAAENDALERAALAVDDAFNGDYHGKPIVERIRALKHSEHVN
jgi:N-acetylglutamate synthase-like GNAT family acetyltransferase